MISINTRQAYSEVYEILNLIDEAQRNKVPKELQEIFKTEKDNNYKKYIDFNIPLENQNLKRETLVIIALLNLEYWCEDENEKQRLLKIYKENEKEYKESMEKKLNFRNTRDDYNNVDSLIATKEIEVYHKESKFKKFINKFLKFIGK